MGLLYGIAFTIKMSYKGSHKIHGYFEYVVPPLEEFWWTDTISTVFDSALAMYQSVLSHFSLQNGGIITACGVKGKGDIAKNSALNEAFEPANNLK